MIPLNGHANNDASAGYLKGKVEYIRVHDPVNENWGPPRFWFSLKGITKAGGCAIWSHSGTVLFVADNQEMYTAVMATYMAGKEIALRYDTAFTAEGYCKVYNLTMGDPPILN